MTFTGTAGITTVVREPKLEVTINAPSAVALGDKVPVTYTVKIGTSTGTYPITFDRSVSDATFSAVVPGRRYYVTVVATNAAGSSANAKSSTTRSEKGST